MPSYAFAFVAVILKKNRRRDCNGSILMLNDFVIWYSPGVALWRTYYPMICFLVKSIIAFSEAKITIFTGINSASLHLCTSLEYIPPKPLMDADREFRLVSQGLQALVEFKRPGLDLLTAGNELRSGDKLE